jgi:hypothetical protein
MPLTWNGDEITPGDVRDRLQKPAKGSGLIDRREKRREIELHEEREKDAVRSDDKRCRWPHCENCRTYKPRLEVAHLDAKGFGGDHGLRSDRTQMILLDYLTHQGADGLEQHGRRIVTLTDRGTRGPCEFWKQDRVNGWYLVARESAPFCYERD